MAWIERLAEFGKVLVTINRDVTDFRETLREMRDDVKSLQLEMSSLRERLARVEAFQSATRAEIEADLSRFKSEVERAETRISRLLPEPRKRK